MLIIMKSLNHTFKGESKLIYIQGYMCPVINNHCLHETNPDTSITDITNTQLLGTSFCSYPNHELAVPFYTYTHVFRK